ncbi:MAG TPA: amidohydrolase family protein [Polyangia bacterium]|jgi:predicted TIM-barrel fold metal-dependent hydrolase|nr:amidohydrolase family protein [Polyangia bacterium]
MIPRQRGKELAGICAAIALAGAGIGAAGCRKPRGAAAEAARAQPRGNARAPTAADASAPTAASARPDRKRLPRIDVHMHIGPDAVPRAIRLMDEWGIDGGVNLSGMFPGPPHHGLETQLAAAKDSQGRLAVFANTDFRLVRASKDYGKAMADLLDESRRLGAIGLKIPKGLGLGYPTADRRHLLPVDDPGLDPLFDKAGALGMPIAIHIGDPKAFWKPATPENERWDELQAHPEWSFYGEPVPSWEQLYDAFERRVARHPRSTFIAVHFGNDPEDPERVAKMLDRYRNFYIDTAARVPEIGRHPVDRMRRFYEKYQDRILFGTDTGVGSSQDEMMYGSNGANPPTRADEIRFFTQTWRYFETLDRQFESPTPIQGRWKIDGVGLPEPILRKVYFDNAAKILRWRPATHP